MADAQFKKRSKNTIWLDDDYDSFEYEDGTAGLTRTFYHKTNHLYGYELFDGYEWDEHVVSNKQSIELEKKSKIGFVPFENEPWNDWEWPKEDGEFYQKC